MGNRVLLIECPDEKGLVHKISGVLFRCDCNVEHNAEFVDHENGRFFMRTEFSGEAGSAQLLEALEAELPERAVLRLPTESKKKVLLLVTREHHCLAELLVRHAYHEMDAEIVGVISNHDLLRPLVEKFDIPYHFISHEGKSREEHEAEVLTIAKNYQPDYLVLAKYMRILTENFVGHYPERIINIHHSFLPAFIGARPYRQAFERGVKIIGATAHFVGKDLDEGPIIAQRVIPTDHSQSVSDMTQAGRDVEKIVLARALKLVLENRVFICGNRTIIFD